MRPFLAVLLFSLILAGCASGGRIRYDTPAEAFDKGMLRFERGDYPRAILFFQGVFDFGRTHEYAADAQLQLARSYRANKEYLLAANEYTRFTQIYRSDERLAQASYELAMTYFDRSPNYKLDQTDTERAINQFQLFINRYGDHPLTQEANTRIVELRDKLAHKRYDAGLQYETRGYFEASALTFESVFNDYYDTTWADDALMASMRAYIAFANQSITMRQAERLQSALDSYDRLIQIFPDSPVIKAAEPMYREASGRIAELTSTSSTSS
jgi:outer membrane protein assembly factor BamD